jgi:hypothetical protein
MNPGEIPPNPFDPDRQAEQRVILLGASNLARAFPTVLHSLRMGLVGPLDIAVAMGHGRSYGTWSQLLGRALPGINQCGLWPHVSANCPQHTRPLAAIADLGNDLVYGVDAQTLLGWLDIILRRLAEINSDVVMLSLPMESLSRMSQARFETIRRLIFPGHAIRWPQLQREIQQLDQGMRELAERYRVGWVDTPGDWYGLDAIHIRRRLETEAWQTLFARWSAWRQPAAYSPLGLLQQLKIRRLRPAERRLFGQQQLSNQPALTTPDCRISLF